MLLILLQLLNYFTLKITYLNIKISFNGTTILEQIQSQYNVIYYFYLFKNYGIRINKLVNH